MNTKKEKINSTINKYNKQEKTAKIKPTKICTQEGLVTVITVGYSYPRKLNPLENLAHEIL